jgi:tryptophanyl-tRNA synthetase
MTQFKDKAGKNSEKASLGLFAYPALMAADILLYKATHVPVGDDQKQHLELTRDIGAKFNNDFGVEFFPITEPLIAGEAARIMSLRDGSKKMSSSDPSELSRISLTDDVDKIAKKIKKAKSDPEPLPSEVAGLEGRAEAKNLVGIFAALSGRSKQDILAEYGGQGFGVFKPALAELAVEKLAPMNKEMARYLDDPKQIEDILRDGAGRASIIAQATMQEVRDIIGFVK